MKKAPHLTMRGLLSQLRPGLNYWAAGAAGAIGAWGMAYGA